MTDGEPPILSVVAPDAGLAVLGELDAAAYQRLDATAAQLSAGIEAAAVKAGVPMSVPRVGPLVGVFFTDRKPSNYDEAKEAADNGVYPRFFHGLLDRGVAIAPGAYEVLFPSLAHTDEDIDRTIQAVSEALSAV